MAEINGWELARCVAIGVGNHRASRWHGDQVRGGRCPPYARRRTGFTLIELLVTIMIIGIIAAMVFGAMARATGAARVAKTKSTIAKLASAVNVKYESYRYRRVPVDPQQVLGQMAQYGSYPYVQYMLTQAVANRLPEFGGPATDPLWSGLPGSTRTIFPSNEQIAFVRLLAIRELMKYEMPHGFSDFSNFTNTTSPPYALLNPPLVLPYPPSIARTYLNYLNTKVTAQSGVTPQQIAQYQEAECLYMVITLGTEDDSLGGKLFDQKMVGDADGDGLPEFQDAWPAVDNPYSGQGQIAGMPGNSPISWLLWAPGVGARTLQEVQNATPVMASDLQPDPNDWQLVAGVWSAQPLQFSLDHHDPFDPLKLDIPNPALPLPQGGPRGFALYPLVYSAGPDGLYEIFEVFDNNGNTSPQSGDYAFYDPYLDNSSGQMPGMWYDSNGNGRNESLDNITNHVIQTR